MTAEITSMEELQTQVVNAGNNADWSEYGSVKATYLDHLVLFNYTEHAQFEARWNWFEQVSRGLILNWQTGEVVARPFDKFFNWGEGGRSSDTEIVSATEKMDGSLGILYRYASDDYRIATRGSFTSEQAIWATAWLNNRLDVTLIPNNWTLLFEIIYPANRIVVNYGERAELVLIGIRDRFTGEDYPAQAVAYYARKVNLTMPTIFDYKTAQDAILGLNGLDVHHEGWVCVFEDGQRFKFKGDAYLLAHKFLSSVSFNNVLESVENNTFDAMIAGVPDEFLTEVKQMRAEIAEDLERHKQIVDDFYVRAMNPIDGIMSYTFIDPIKDMRKEFALWVRDNVPAEYRSMMFNLFDGRAVTPLIYKLIRQSRKAEEITP